MNITIDKSTGVSAADLWKTLSEHPELEIVSMDTGGKTKFPTSSMTISDGTASKVDVETLKKVLPYMEHPEKLNESNINRSIVYIKKDLTVMVTYVFTNMQHNRPSHVFKVTTDLLTADVSKKEMTLEDLDADAISRKKDEWYRHNYLSPMLEIVGKMGEAKKNMFFVEVPVKK